MTSLSVVGGPADTDGDGLPDVWENRFGLESGVDLGADGASGDPDGDGRRTRRSSSTARIRAVLHALPRGGRQRRVLRRPPGAASRPTRAARGARALSAGRRHAVTQLVVGARATRRTFDPRRSTGLASADFSTVVESDALVVVDRTMTWDGGYGSHAETALPAASTTWYLAEGSTSGIQPVLPAAEPERRAGQVHDHAICCRSAQAPIVKPVHAAARRRTNDLRRREGGALAAPTSRRSSPRRSPIIVERAMYRHARPAVRGRATRARA